MGRALLRQPVEGFGSDSSAYDRNQLDTYNPSAVGLWGLLAASLPPVSVKDQESDIKGHPAPPPAFVYTMLTTHTRTHTNPRTYTNKTS